MCRTCSGVADLCATNSSFRYASPSERCCSSVRRESAPARSPQRDYRGGFSTLALALRTERGWGGLLRAGQAGSGDHARQRHEWLGERHGKSAHRGREHAAVGHEDRAVEAQRRGSDRRHAEAGVAAVCGVTRAGKTLGAKNLLAVTVVAGHAYPIDLD